MDQKQESLDILMCFLYIILSTTVSALDLTDAILFLQGLLFSFLCTFPLKNFFFQVHLHVMVVVLSRGCMPNDYFPDTELMTIAGTTGQSRRRMSNHFSSDIVLHLRVRNISCASIQSICCTDSSFLDW